MHISKTVHITIIDRLRFALPDKLPAADWRYYMNNKKFYRKLRYLALMTAVVAVIVLVFSTLTDIPNTVFSNKESQQDDLPVIILDPGHGGIDGGCVAINGVPEKGINLAIASQVRDILSTMGYHVVMTRDKDVSIYDKGVKGVGNQKRSDMDNRLALINSYPDAVAVSIHQNQFTDPQYSGAQMFYSNTDPLSEELAQTMQKKFVANIQPDNNRETKEVGDELFLLYYSKCPMIMAECGFLSNPEESEKLQSDEYQRQVAFTIASGIVEFVENNYEVK